MKTAIRLEGYYPFNADIIDQVSNAMESQARFGTYENFLDAVGANNPKPYSLDGYSQRQILDIRPRHEDPDNVVVMHLPMANPLDTNQQYQLATLAYAMPNSRIIAMGHPSGGEFVDGGLTFKQRCAVAHGNFKPVIDPLVSYLDKEQIETVINIGGSYGAELAASLAGNGTHETTNTVYIEPASIKKRNVLRLGLDFKSSEPPMAAYVAANELQTFIDARKAGIRGNDYIKGLIRPTNIAASRGLGQGKFEEHAVKALKSQHGMQTTFAWGTKSELATDDIVSTIADAYTVLAGVEHVRRIRMQGQTHALGNDLALTSVIVLQSLKQ